MKEKLAAAGKGLKEFLWYATAGVAFGVLEGVIGLLRDQKKSRVRVARFLSLLPGTGYIGQLVLWCGRQALRPTARPGRPLYAAECVKILARLLGRAQSLNTRNRLREELDQHVHPALCRLITRKAVLEHQPQWSRKEIQQLIQADDPELREAGLRMARNVG